MKSPLLTHLPLAAAILGLSASGASGVTLLFDFSHDAAMDNFFASNPTAKAALDAAAADVGAAITSSLAAINHATITGTNGGTSADFTWSYTYLNPSTGAQETLTDTSLPADSVRIYAGMRPLGGTTLGQGGFGGAGLTISGGGSPSEWEGAVADAEAQSNAVYGRGGGPAISSTSNSVSLGGTSAAFSVTFGPTVGHLWFDIDTDNDTFVDDSTTLANFWHFDHTTPVASGKNDFYSVALHEILHVLGIGSAASWDAHVSGTDWTGPEVIALMGGGSDLIDADGSHIAPGVMSQRLSDGGLQEAVMDPNLTTGTRKYLTELDLAFLRDIGWETAVAIPEPGVAGLGALATAAMLLRRRRSAA